MKLAELKRAMSLGTKWECKHISGWSPGIREVVQVKSAKVGFKTVRDSGEVVISWTDFPKAKDLKINGEWVEFWDLWYMPGEREARYVPVLKYRQV